MSLENRIGYSYNDIVIIPAKSSRVKHRSECNPFYSNGYLPIFTAPMDTVVNENNINIFKENNIIPIIPRNIPYENRIIHLQKGEWVALGLNEFEYTFIKNVWSNNNNVVPKVLIDIANGHMNILHDMVMKAKEIYGQENIIIMVGNIANPETYELLCDCGADYVRCSIGTGNGCLSTSNLGVHYPIATLISDISNFKKYRTEKGLFTTNIIADGGIRNYSDVIKALALGADYVMCGSIFAQFIESAAPMYFIDINNIDFKYYINPFKDKIIQNENGSFNVTLFTEQKEMNGLLENKNVILKKEFYGMASKQGQIAINGKKTKTSEGVKKILDVTTSISKWSENMAAYLRSAMSYTDCLSITEFVQKDIRCMLMSNQTKASINK